MDIESWKSFFDIGTVALLFLTFMFGVGVLITGNIINKRQASQLSQFDERLTDSKLRLANQEERAAKAETEASEAKKSASEALAKQQSIEISLRKEQERATSLEVAALKLRKDLTLQGARENLISGEKRQQLVATLKHFSGQKVDVRYSAQALMVNSAVVSSTPLGDDTMGLAAALLGVTKDAGWPSPPEPLLYSVQGYGIVVDIAATASSRTQAAASGLAKALREASLLVSGPQIVPQERLQRVGTGAQELKPTFDENTIVLGVLTHPK